MTMIELNGARPKAAPDCWLADTCTVIGDVTLGERSSVWFSAVLRGDLDSITVGVESNIQDGCVLHTDPGLPLTVGSGVSVGHRAVLHGCTVADDVLIGMGATVLNGARIGAGSLIAAGAVVLEGTQVPERSLVAGVPGKVRRPLTDDEVTAIQANARSYVELARRYAAQARAL